MSARRRGHRGLIQPSLLAVLAVVIAPGILSSALLSADLVSPGLVSPALLSPAMAAEPSEAVSTQPSCADLPPSTLRMYGTRHDGLSVAPATMAEIDRTAAQHNIPEPMRHAPLVLMVPQLTSSFAVDERAVAAASSSELESGARDSGPRESGVFCAAPSSVELRMGITDYKVFIERSAFADDCVREHLLDHARRHLEADNRALVAVMEQMRDPLTDALGRLKAAPAATAGEAVARLKSGVARLLLEAVERFGRQRVARHAEIDTPEEMAGLSAACDGRMRLLESRARQPGRDT
jgi:hypothetical protein